MFWWCFEERCLRFRIHTREEGAVEPDSVSGGSVEKTRGWGFLRTRLTKSGIPSSRGQRAVL